MYSRALTIDSSWPPSSLSACRYRGFRFFGQTQESDNTGVFLKEDIYHRCMADPDSQPYRVWTAMATEAKLSYDDSNPTIVENIHTTGAAITTDEGSYLASTAGPQFLHLLDDEISTVERHGSNALFRFQPPYMRQQCDKCNTSIFNAHFVCDECCLELCVQCHTDWATNKSHVNEGYMLKHSRHSESEQFTFVYTIPLAVLHKRRAEFRERFPRVAAWGFDMLKADKYCDEKACDESGHTMWMEDRSTGSSPKLPIVEGILDQATFRRHMSNGVPMRIAVQHGEELARWTAERMVVEGTKKMSIVEVVDCDTGKKITMPVAEFFRGYNHSEDCDVTPRRVLKLHVGWRRVLEVVVVTI